VLAFNTFLDPYAITANVAPRLHKELENNNLPLSERNLSFFRNVLNYNASDFPESLNYSEEIAF